MKYQERVVIGDCTLYLADSNELMHEIGWVGCMVFDPPYEFQASGGGKFRRQRDNMDKIQAAGLDKGFDLQIMSPTFRCNSCVVFCCNDQLPSILEFIEMNYERFAVLTYHKTNPMPVRNKHYLPDTEFYIHAWNRGAHPIGEHSDMKRYYIGNNGKDKNINHPTPKPIPLMDKIITNANSDIICDPFMGSGSTAISCINKGKKFIGIEKNPVFFAEAVERIKNHKNIVDTNESKS